MKVDLCEGTFDEKESGHRRLPQASNALWFCRIADKLTSSPAYCHQQLYNPSFLWHTWYNNTSISFDRRRVTMQPYTTDSV